MKTEGAKAPFLFLEHNFRQNALWAMQTTETSRSNLLADLKASVQTLLDGYFVDQPWFVVESRWSPDARKLIVNLDGDQGVTIEVCTALNRALGALVDEHPYDAPVVLEVGSPGADSPLGLPRQYPQHQGRRLQVTTAQGEVHEGLLIDVDQEGFGLETPKETLRFSFNQVRTSRVLLPF